VTAHYGHGLVIGKFYPPHRGHLRLIEVAAGSAIRVTVVVMATGAETIPLAERVEWLRRDVQPGAVRVTGVVCESPVDLHDPNVWAAQIAAIRSALRVGSSDCGDVDVVASGESYGNELARRLGADHLRVQRDELPLSATAIRADPADRWDDLSPASRRGLTTRVVVVGAESTGTTTLAAAVADRYRARGGLWGATRTVEEYGRDYTAELWAAQGQPTLNDVVWSPADFDAIAHHQTEMEEEAAAAGSPLLVCDTDAFATSVWGRRYLGDRASARAPWAEPPLLPAHHLYLLTSHVGVPWVDDGLREGDLAVRAAMTEWFADALTAGGHPWVLLEGTVRERVELAVRCIDEVLARHMTWADPLTGPGFELSPSRSRRRSPAPSGVAVRPPDRVKGEGA
jgi:HTH-type transcriptional repressor of NAD biosynthesis genes